MRMPAIRASVYVAVLLTAGVALWLWSGTWDSGGDAVSADGAPAEAASEDSGGAVAEGVAEEAAPSAPDVPRVRTVSSDRQVYRAALSVTGRTSVNRTVTVRAETAGPIAAVRMEESRYAPRGRVLATIAPQDRSVRLAEAEALLEQRRVEAKAANALAARGFQSEIQRAAADTNLRSAEAAVQAIKLDMENTTIEAPISGRVEEQFVHVGDYVQPGSAVATLVDLNPLLVRASIPEQHLASVRVGGAADVALPGAGTAVVAGTIRRVAPVADDSTRTFEVVVAIDNSDGALSAGMTATVSLPLAPVEAHLVPSSLLSLDSGETMGVKVVDADGAVRFLPVAVVGDTADGLWVTGLPETVRLISVGHEFVHAGQVVRATPDTRPVLDLS